MRSKKICPDCGPATLTHFIEWTSALFGVLLAPISRLCQLIDRTFSRAILPLRLSRFGLPFFRALSICHLGRLNIAVDEQDSLRTRALWESATKLGISLWQFRFFNYPPASLFIAKQGTEWRVFDALPRPARLSSESWRWMDDKAILRRHLVTAGLPVARGGAFFTLTSAKRLLVTIDGPLIAKPHIGSRSRHTTTHINSEAELVTAFNKAKQLSPWVIVEEELKGEVFRGTVIAGKLAGIVRREMPSIRGNGRQTVGDLVQQENKNPQRQGPFFHTIPLDQEAQKELQRQGLTLGSVPSVGQVVVIHPKMSRGFGASTTELTGQAHPDNVVMFERVAELLGDSLVGIDFIVEDISQSWQTQAKCGIIECNSLPFIDLHHYPLDGEPNPVGDYLWKKVFPAVG